jgi:hypothetical protein
VGGWVGGHEREPVYGAPFAWLALVYDLRDMRLLDRYEARMRRQYAAKYGEERARREAPA